MSPARCYLQSLRPGRPEEPLFNIVKHRVVLYNRKILCLGKKLFVWVDAWTKQLWGLRCHLAHLLGHLASSCRGCQREFMDRPLFVGGRRSSLPLSLPKRKLKTGCRPKMHKKYQLMLDIHLGSMSLVATPACSMLLNLMVNGNGSFTASECVSKNRRYTRLSRGHDQGANANALMT